MTDWIKENESRLINIRRYLHRHPEIGYEEHNTSDYLKNILQQSGYEIYRNDQMGTGFYCEYGEGKGPVLGIRCDLDGLPIQDTKTVDYRSKNDCVMHACGHDVHMAIVTGFAIWLRETHLPLKGKIRFIYQPAEEQAPGGALQMIDAGILDTIDNLIGIHVLPSMEVGKIGIRAGTTSAKVQLLDLNLTGPGGHTSRPHETINLVYAAAQLIEALNAVSEKYTTEENPVVLSFGEINGGNTFNVIPSHISMKGTLRYINANLEETINQEIHEAVDDIVQLTGAHIDFKVPYSVPMVENDPQITTMVAESAARVLGDKNVVFLPRSSMGSDDFGFYARKRPSVFMRIGCANGMVKDLHVSDFNVNEKCMQTALKVLKSVIETYFLSKT
jgi:amidohydrolase